METQTKTVTLPPREKMHPDAVRLRDIYARKPDAPIVMREFGFYSLDRWKNEGMTSITETLHSLGCCEEGQISLRNMGWCEAEFYPRFEEKVLSQDGDHELAQDYAGRKVLYFKGRRNGFMPTYVEHPVKDLRSFEENCLWRMGPNTPERVAETRKQAEKAVEAAAQGKMIQLCVGGAYMYLRSLIGPEDLLLKFYDDPEVIHACMRQWLLMNSAACAQYQQYVTADEVFFGEDICYKNGMLISPEMWREFLKPYYQQLIADIRSRQLDKTRHLYIQIDTDGDCRPAIPLYREIGMDCMSPFEVASGCDVVEIGRDEPNLVMFGGFDKRILSQSTDDIDREVDRILPIMRRRGGYIPTCDHGVPEEVSFSNWLHFRKRLLEYSR